MIESAYFKAKLIFIIFEICFILEHLAWFKYSVSNKYYNVQNVLDEIKDNLILHYEYKIQKS